MPRYMRPSGYLSEEERFLHPDRYISYDQNSVYKKNHVVVDWPKKKKKIFFATRRLHTTSVVGVALGDEGKGRVIDNLIDDLHKIRGVAGVMVVRFQGGNNSGHTVEANGVHLALHQIPCGIMYKKATCIMDRGMTIHPVDLISEIHYVEERAGTMKGRLFLSQDAILNTDLDRAEEILNRKRQGKAGGGTGRGIGPSYAHHYDRLGLHISDLIDPSWRTLLGKQYRRSTKEFALYGMRLQDTEVPDFAKTKKTGREHKMTVGTKRVFLDRLKKARRELIARSMVTNTYLIHRRIYPDERQAVFFEGAQALGLHPWLGTIPDITASDTSTYGIQSGTGFWLADDIEQKIGVFKISYTSSVGVRRMPTQASKKWADRVREEAHEYGTTTGRPRDILFPDLPLLLYNCRMSGVDKLIGTHLDIAWEDIPIPVCTHYTDKHGNLIPYQPGLLYLQDVVPHYIKLPGWDGEAVRQAKTFQDLPAHAKKFLAFLMRRLGIPIVAVTTGPKRDNYLKIS